MRLAPPAFALLVAALVYVAPVSNGGSDAALQLVAAQALVEHGCLDLAVYRDDPRLAYDLEHDYRVVRSGAARRYYLVLPPILDAPFVWLAQRVGFDMLFPGDEQALQNLLSALVCGLAALLLFELCARLLEPWAALLVSAVATLGSPLVSTLGTALWPAGSALLLTLLALLLVARPGPRPGPGRLALAVLAMLLAYLCRPASAFAALGLIAAGLVALEGRSRRLALGALGLLLAMALGAAAWLGWRRLGTLLPIYYSPLKAWPNTPLGLGLPGTLFSPGRGLFVFCPFLLPIVLGALAAGRRLWREPLAWLAGTWIASQVLLTSVKSWWWGGNSYGPRLLLETVPAWALLACLVWRAESRPGARRWLAASFLLLGLPSIAIHSGQGLWNPAVLAWNRGPSAQLDQALLFDWRFPQFLATHKSVAERDLMWQLERLEVLEPGQLCGADSRRLAYLGFHPLEGGWRPSAPDSALRFRPRGFAPDRRYLLELRASSASPQPWHLEIPSWRSEAAVASPGPYCVRLALPGAVLLSPGERELRLQAPAAAPAGPGDTRLLGPRFHSLRLLPWPEWTGELRAEQDAFFAEGFGDAEGQGRWTVAPRAALHLPVLGPAGARLRLLLRGRGNGTQRVALEIDGRALGELRFEDAPSTQAVEFEAPAGPALLTLLLPDARALPADPRRLGLYVVSLRIEAPGAARVSR